LTVEEKDASQNLNQKPDPPKKQRLQLDNAAETASSAFLAFTKQGECAEQQLKILYHQLLLSVFESFTAPLQPLMEFFFKKWPNFLPNSRMPITLS
jgi:hypothetical protein